MMDLGGVYFTEGKKIAIKKISRKYSSINTKKLNKLLSQKSYHAGLWRKGKMSQKDFIKILSKKMNISEKVAVDIIRIWYNSYTPNKGMKNLVRKTRRHNMVVVLSGNIKERVKYLDSKYKFQKEFDKCFYSHTLGINKPSVRIFRAAIKNLNARPKDCIMVDDLGEFLTAVKKTGARTIKFKNVKQLESDLRKIGVML